jgi:hypothetical protein
VSDETPEQHLRSALTTILNRIDTARDSNQRLPPLMVAIALEATIGLTDAYPDDRLYAIWRGQWEAISRHAEQGRRS